MHFSIITPSFRNSRWLKLCIASVADQRFLLEHIIQDAGSDDGTLEWLPHDPRVRAFVEKDQGMYDAVNRGLRRAQGELLAYLNCDEQFLPGALEKTHAYLQAHPQVDVVFGNVVLVNDRGEYVAHRKAQVPLKYHTWTSHLCTLTCATFFRRRLISELGFLFDPKLRDVGDGEWMVRLLRAGISMGVLKEFTSTFTYTGANMSVGANARRENKELRGSAPAWVRGMRPLWIAQHRFRKLFTGAYRQAPFEYEIFTLDSPQQRIRFEARHPNYRWPAKGN